MSDALLVQQVASGSGDPTSSMKFINDLAADPLSVSINTYRQVGRAPRWLSVHFISTYRLGDAANQPNGNIGVFQLTATGSSDNGAFVMPTKTWVNLTGNYIQLTAGSGAYNPAMYIVFSQTWPQGYSAMGIQVATNLEVQDVNVPFKCDFTCRFGYFVLSD